MTMMNQNRSIAMIKRLARDYKIDLLTSDKNQPSLVNSVLPEIENVYFFKDHKNFSGLRKIFFYFKTCLYVCVFLYPEHYHTIINKSLRNTLKHLIKNNNYNTLLLHYWYLRKVLPKKLFNSKIVIDTHGLIFEKVKLESLLFKGFWGKKMEAIYARNYKKQEVQSLNQADLLIFNSEKDKVRYQVELNGTVQSETISNGQDLSYFAVDNNLQATNTILFYGSLGGAQNQLAFKKFWLEIYPLILKEKEDVRLVILGNNPPKWVNELESESVIITGFVEDIRPFLAESNVCILPLITGAGFRGRVVEVMAMGVPVVGTHNALDSVNMTHGKQGFITDNNEEMAHHVLEILNNKELNQELSENCIQFIKNNYSIEATYGKLSSVINKNLQ